MANGWPSQGQGGSDYVGVKGRTYCQQAPDVIIATGAMGCRPAIPGIDSPQVVEAARHAGEVPAQIIRSL